ncbi:GNAT family N-acetyltransferase [Gorillibacterium sp. sgz500922]|uniref:GNAT family N-acetyltransferase n=1 Tax=Gorillibacterium sp. sgz500922 TaxID=3446694 RepID=UPI003F677FDF
MPANPSPPGGQNSDDFAKTRVLRSERPDDYHAINEMTVEAFQHHPYCNEGALTALLRSRPGYRPDLSLVAEYRGTLIGHALFTPLTIRLGGEDLPAVLLAPLTVHPDFQKRGVGSQLVKEGHRRAAAMGFRFSFLTGHPEYYPRLGYVPGMFGAQWKHIPVDRLPRVPLPPLEERRVQANDLPDLVRLWERWHEDAEFVRRPEPSITDWISANPRIASVTVSREGRLIGYLRYAKQQPWRVFAFLAESRESAALLLALLADRLPAGTERLELALPPGELPLMPIAGEDANERWSAAMICPLAEGDSFLLSRMDGIAEGRIHPGPLVWPPEFEGEE